MITLFGKNYIKLHKSRARKRMSDRHRRRKCGHCDQELSYTAFRSHKSLYYDESARKWIRSSSLPAAPTICPEVEATFQDQLDEGLMDTMEAQAQSSISPGM